MRIVRKTPRGVNYQTRRVIFPTIFLPSQTTQFPPVSVDRQVVATFGIDDLKAALNYQATAAIARSMFELYEAFKVKKGIVRWRHQPGSGQSESVPTTPYTGSYYTQLGEIENAQAATAAAASAADCTSLPFGRRHGRDFGTRTFFPTLVTSNSYMESDAATATTSALLSRENKWYLTRTVLGAAVNVPNQVTFVGPTICLPGREHVGPLFATPGAVTGFAPGNWAVTLECEIMFKGAQYGWSNSGPGRAIKLPADNTETVHKPWATAGSTAENILSGVGAAIAMKRKYDELKM